MSNNVNNFRAFFLFLIASSINIFLSIFLVKLSINKLLNIYESIFLKVSLPVILIFIFRFTNIRNDLKKVTKKNILLLFGISIASLIDVFSWMKAISYIPINNAILFGFFVPILTLIVSSFINKDKVIIFRKKVSIFISFLATILSFNFIIHSFNIGYIFLLIDILSAVFIIILLKKLHVFSSYFILIVRLSLVIPFSIFVNNFFIDSNFHILLANHKNFLYFLIPIFYLIERLSHIKMYKYGEISFIEPLKYLNIVFSSIFGYLLIDQKLTSNQVIAFVIIIISNIVGNSQSLYRIINSIIKKKDK